MIDEFARVLAHAMGLKSMNKNQEALEEIKDAYKTYFGLEYEELEKKSPENFIREISAKTDFKKEQLDALARALMAEGTLYPLNPVKTDDCRLKALSLFRHLEVIDAETFSLARKSAIKELEALLSEGK
jgi:hypothetical protein